MRASLHGRLTYANVVSTLCLFLLLAGGAATAATGLGRGSVGTGQLRDGAVTMRKLRAETRNSLRGQRGPAGPAGPIGPQGAKGERGEHGLSVSGVVASATPATLASSRFGEGFIVLDSHLGGKDVVIDSKATLVIQGSTTIAAVDLGDPIPVTCRAYVRDPLAPEAHDIAVGAESQISLGAKEVKTIAISGFVKKAAAGTWSLRLGCATGAGAGGALFEGGSLTAVATDP